MRNNPNGETPRTTDLDHSQIPVFFYLLREIYQSDWDHPVSDSRRIWIEREDFQLNGVELVNWDGRFGIRIEILV